MKASTLLLCSLVTFTAVQTALAGKAPTAPGVYKEWGPDIDEIEIVKTFLDSF